MGLSETPDFNNLEVRPNTFIHIVYNEFCWGNG